MHPPAFRASCVGLVLSVLALAGCQPKTIQYEIEVTNDYPGTRVGIYAADGTTLLVSTTLARDTLRVKAPYAHAARPTAHLVDAPLLRDVPRPYHELTEEQRRAMASQGRPVPMRLSVIRDRALAEVEVVIASPTDEVITVGDIKVDGRAVTPWTRLVVPAPSPRVTVKVGADAPIVLETSDRETGSSDPASFVFVDPLASTCVQSRNVVYGAGHLVANDGTDAPLRLAPARAHVFPRLHAPHFVFGEKVPSSIMGIGLGVRRVLERCSAGPAASRPGMAGKPKR